MTWHFETPVSADDSAVPTIGEIADGLSTADFARGGTVRETVVGEMSKAVVGHTRAIELLTVAAVAGGHVLIEGPPGVAKTLLARGLAHALGVSFSRVQFTPDTAPKHILGETVLKMGEPHFIPGPIFTNVLLADEINRTPPRTQAALLEAMQEKHVTVDGRSRWLPSPFIVIATQNPLEQSGVYALPESQLDRFLFKIALDYGTPAEELQMLGISRDGLSPDVLGSIQPCMDTARLMAAQDGVNAVVVPNDVAEYVIRVVRSTREFPGVVLGASPRAAVHLLVAAKANAWIDGRDTVSTADVRAMGPRVLEHRLLCGEAEPADVVQAALAAADGPGA